MLTNKGIEVLYITRKYPPSVGGMQRVCYQLAQSLAQITSIKIIAWGGGQYFLPLFVSWAGLQASFFLLLHRKDKIIVHLGDGLLSPLGVALKILFDVPVTVTIHGRDIAFSNKIYQLIIPKALTRLDKVICVSHQIKYECIKRGIPSNQCVVIPNGINNSEFSVEVSEEKKRELIEKITGRIFKKKNYVLLTVGRLVPKKGIDFFIEKVLLHILAQENNVIYLVVGDGILRSQIETIIWQQKLQNHVFLLGQLALNDNLLKTLYAVADLFIMPNIPVIGDFEGFGVVALEASASKLYIVAARTDGIQDSVKNGINGSLVKPGNVNEFVTTILNLLREDEKTKQIRKQQARQLVETEFGWKTIAITYLNLFNDLITDQIS